MSRPKRKEQSIMHNGKVYKKGTTIELKGTKSPWLQNYPEAMQIELEPVNEPETTSGLT